MKAIWAGVAIILLGAVAEAAIGIEILQHPDRVTTARDVIVFGVLVAVSLCVALAPALTRNAKVAALCWLFLGLGGIWWLFMGLLPLVATLPAGLVTGTCWLIGKGRDRLRSAR